ncbi:Flavodoxin domain, partial [Dysosmobacter welbionis]
FLYIQDGGEAIPVVPLRSGFPAEVRPAVRLMGLRKRPGEILVYHVPVRSGNGACICGQGNQLLRRHRPHQRLTLRRLFIIKEVFLTGCLRQSLPGRVAGQAGHQVPGEEMPQVIPIRQHMPPQLRVGHAVGKNVQPAVLHPPNVGGEGFLPGNHGGHTPADGQPLLMELGLVVRHDAHRAIRMEVP